MIPGMNKGATAMTTTSVSGTRLVKARTMPIEMPTPSAANNAILNFGVLSCFVDASLSFGNNMYMITMNEPMLTMTPTNDMTNIDSELEFPMSIAMMELAAIIND